MAGGYAKPACSPAAANGSTVPHMQTGQDNTDAAGPGLDMPLDDERQPHPARDVFVGLFILAWACAGWISIAGNAYIFNDVGLDPGPSLLPIAVLSILSVGGLAILASGGVRALRTRIPQTARPHGLARSLRPHLVPAALLVSMVAYPALMTVIGYTAATVVFVLGWILALTGWRRLADGRARLFALLGAVLATAAVAAILYTGFVVVIHAPLP